MKHTLACINGIEPCRCRMPLERYSRTYTFSALRFEQMTEVLDIITEIDPQYNLKYCKMDEREHWYLIVQMGCRHSTHMEFQEDMDKRFER